MTFDAGDLSDSQNSPNAIQYKSYAIPVPVTRQGDGLPSPKSKNESGFTNCLLAGNSSGYKIKTVNNEGSRNNSPTMHMTAPNSSIHKRN